MYYGVCTDTNVKTLNVNTGRKGDGRLVHHLTTSQRRASPVCWHHAANLRFCGDCSRWRDQPLPYRTGGLEGHP